MRFIFVGVMLCLLLQVAAAQESTPRSGGYNIHVFPTVNKAPELTPDSGPLLYHGGPVLQTGVTTYAIFWVPPQLQNGNPTSMTLGQFSNGSQLRGLQNPVRDSDAKHEAGQRLALAALPAEHAGPVSLGVNAPPAEVGAEPFGRYRSKPRSREAPDFVERLPRILLALQTLDSLCFRLGYSFRHKKKNPPPAFYWRWVR
jgi:hypothetical protein